ncbi:MAG TPA: histidine kinase, partial [Bacteroidaceae bacterium]|nr:histidine kinase [Bacteroidaceae bacterium]
MKRPGLFIILTLFFLASSHAQDKYIRFKRITINDGLSLSSVYCIYQDSKGFMWFGTEDGLNRFDGKNITVYGIATDQRYMLSNKWIEIIYEDKSGILWLGSRGGLTKYNPRTGIFNPIRHNRDDERSLSNDTITAITSDIFNTVWVGTPDGLNQVDRNTNIVRRIIPVEEEYSGLTSRIRTMLNDKSGNL